VTKKRAACEVAPLARIEGLSPETISACSNLSESYIDQNRSLDKRRDLLWAHRHQLFFENSTRTRRVSRSRPSDWAPT